MKKFFFAFLTLTFLSSCVQTSSGVYSGLWTEWRDRDPMSKIDNSVEPIKKGETCINNILGIISTGDNSIETAKKDGDIRKISFVDRSYRGLILLYFPIFSTGCTIVHGN